ncbi:leucine rich adaptor protein 1-like [Seriola lalandi dorsalis]|uniref:Leucine rich adaptor protein 1 like n=1 Tax=Seriola lalandi dorsalis TaxID=1841481 RepID=A0A3B4X1A9_SERLL|nr:leucine rich adaptor protein 1-like [Seriola lalandi dorsalis]XP_056225954.1 leucine rich adaptor protein 1-like [Seriola aureovittata]
MDEDNSVLPDLKDIETKLGRKVPDSLIRSLVGGKYHDKHDKSAAPHLVNCKLCSNSADLKRLESKMQFLKQEMAHLRAIDLKLMQQLMSINEGIESIRWMIEDKGGAASQDGSLTGSLYSLSDSQDGTSLRGSFSSLNDGNSDNLDGLSVGSYLDTLAEDLPDDPSPTDLDGFGDKTVIDGDSFSKSPLKLRVESDEYYCFG